MKTESYTDYLKSRGFSRSSIESCEATTNFFLSWLRKQDMKPEQVRYADVLAYMKVCQHRGIERSTMQKYIGSVKIFYDHLVDQHRMKSNPVLNVKVLGVKKRTLYHIFEPNELHAIYNNYEGKTLSGKKNKVIIGMLVYQGMKTEELDRLGVKDVKLKEGKIEIAGGRKYSARTLQLESHQVMDVYDYVMQVRPRILEKTKQQTDRFFVSLEGGDKLRVDYLMGQLRAQYPKVESFYQLRASVIVKWLRQYNLREVQYLAGHRYISSTEAYMHSEMEGLTEEVNKFHPLG